MADELPPLIAQLVGDASDVYSMLDDLEARLAAFANQDFTANVGVNTTGADAAIAETEAALDALGDTTATPSVGLDDSALLAGIARAQIALLALAKEMDTMSLEGANNPLFSILADLRSDLENANDAADIKGIMAQVLITRGAIADMKTDLIDTTVEADALSDSISSFIDSIGASAGESTAVLMGLDIEIAKVRADAAAAALEVAAVGVAADVAAAGGGGGGGKGGLATALGFGGVGRGVFGILGAGAGIGTLGSLFGGGTESILTTLLGVGGSALGALAGGGALLTGALGVGATGMATDLAGIGQAAGDAKNYTTALNALNRAIAVYGQGSVEAAAAQYDLNDLMNALTPAAQKGVIALSQAGQAFHAVFDQLTGAAEATGAAILTQIVGVAAKFLPTIGSFAEQNMKIIQGSMQPLMAWLTGPGLAIFTQLEQQFTNSLPTAVHAGTQAFELLGKTLAFLAPYTGALISGLDRLFTKLNGPDFGKFTSGIARAIDIFHVWEGLIEAIGTALYELFHHDAGTGTDLIEELTHLIDRFNDWANTVAGGDALHALLVSHRNEILSIIQILGQMIAAYGQFELLVRPVLMDVVTLLAEVLNFLSKIPGVGQLLGLILTFEILGSRIKFLEGYLKSFNNLLKSLVADGLELLGAGLIKLGGPFATIGNWITGLGTKIDKSMVSAADAMAASTDSMVASVDRLTAALESIGPAGDTAAANLDSALGTMDASMEATAGVATETAATTDAALATEGGAGAAGGAGGAVKGLGGFLGAEAGSGAVLGTVALSAAAVATLSAGIAVAVHSILNERNTPAGQYHGTTHTAQAAPAITAGMGNQAAVASGTDWAKVFAGMASAATVASDKAEMLNINLNALTSATGLGRAAATGLANDLGIKLNQAMNPAQIAAFTAYVKANGGATAVTASQWDQASAHIQSALVLMAEKAHTAMPTVTQSVANMVNATQPHLVDLVAKLNKTGDQGGAEFVSSFLAHLTPAELASKQMHDGVHSPLFPLEQELSSIGDTSAANMIAKFIGHKGAAQNAATQVHDSIKNPLYALQTELASTGDIGGAGLVEDFLKHNAQARTASGLMSVAMQGGLVGLGKALAENGSSSAQQMIAAFLANEAAAAGGGYNVGSALGSGVARGISAYQSVVDSAASNLVTGALAHSTLTAIARSPSRLFAERLGKPIAQGVAVGILEEAHLVHAAASGLVTGSLPSLGVSPLVGGGAGGGGTTTVISQPVNLILNNQQVGNAVLQILLKKGRSTGNILGQYSGGSQTGTATGINTNAVQR